MLRDSLWESACIILVELFAFAFDSLQRFAIRPWQGEREQEGEQGGIEVSTTTP